MANPGVETAGSVERIFAIPKTQLDQKIVNEWWNRINTVRCLAGAGEDEHCGNQGSRNDHLKAVEVTGSGRETDAAATIRDGNICLRHDVAARIFYENIESGNEERENGCKNSNRPTVEIDRK